MAKRHKSGDRPTMPVASVRFHYNTQHLSLDISGMPKGTNEPSWGVFDYAGDGVRTRHAVLTAVSCSADGILADLSNSRPNHLASDSFQLKIDPDAEMAIWRGRDFATLTKEKLEQITTLLTLDIRNLIALWKRTSLCTVSVAESTILVNDLVVDGLTYTIGRDDQRAPEKAA